ncbi:MAG: polyprenyl synthetase family protein [Gammaproteobacteria bacterium]|nr:polyprenyl synthetase family protein [Gammaproteobacteria bacterium]MDD9868667.1 polyprenyl synthetase family protein [Gammaproteobacteria bacterium]
METQITEITSQISGELAQVDALIERRLHSGLPLVGELGGHVTGGGKRLRPVLVLLSALVGGGVRRGHLELAAGIEFIHSATLLHDDVVDDSALRRGRRTARDIWGNAASVLVGDFLYSRAFQMICEIGHAGLPAALSRATNVIAEGEVRQLVNLRRADTGEDEYLRVIECKTAALFEVACRGGAMVAGAGGEVLECAAGYGLNTGLAFQLVDDLLDYTGAGTGKTRGQDLREGKPTLPFIHALAHCGPRDADALRGAFGGDDGLDAALAVFEAAGSLDYTRERARHYAARARECLAPLAASPGKAALEALAGFVVERER